MKYKSPQDIENAEPSKDGFGSNDKDFDEQLKYFSTFADSSIIDYKYNKFKKEIRMVIDFRYSLDKQERHKTIGLIFSDIIKTDLSNNNYVFNAWPIFGIYHNITDKHLEFRIEVNHIKIVCKKFYLMFLGDARETPVYNTMDFFK